MSHFRGFSLTQLAVLIVLAVVLISWCLAIGAQVRTQSRWETNSAQLRGIHQGMYTFAQS